MHWWLVAVVLLGGCDKLFGLHEIGIDARTADASADAMVFLDAPPAGTVCAGMTSGGPLHICAMATELEDRDIAGTLDIDTDNMLDCGHVVPPDGGQPALCALIANNLTIRPNATITAHGSRPLVLVAMQMLTNEGTVDVSSYSGGMLGASADYSGCLRGDGSVQGAGDSTSGGGAGGSFGTLGGDGGPPANGTAAAAPPQIDPTTLTNVRGGCPGGFGGLDHDTNAPAGGHSGGAVYLMAGDSITMTSGTVLANGTGGTGGASVNPADFPGGAGGGTGGLIMLDAPSIIVVNSTLMASGGGGGAGQGASGMSGGGGADPNPLAPLNPASGGLSTGTGGSGGYGSSQIGPGPGGNPAGTVGAGGGGGGGAGVIRLFGPAQTTGSNIAPAQT